MSQLEAFFTYGFLVLCLLFTIGVLMWAWVLVIRDEWTERMKQAERMDLDTAANPQPPLPFCADREIEVPPDAVTEVDR